MPMPYRLVAAAEGDSPAELNPFVQGWKYLNNKTFWGHCDRILKPGTVRRSVQYRWEPHGCQRLLADFSVGKFCALTARRGLDVMIVGDSLTGEIFISLIALLRGRFVKEHIPKFVRPFGTKMNVVNGTAVQEFRVDAEACTEPRPPHEAADGRELLSDGGRRARNATAAWERAGRRLQDETLTFGRNGRRLEDETDRFGRTGRRSRNATTSWELRERRPHSPLSVRFFRNEYLVNNTQEPRSGMKHMFPWVPSVGRNSIVVLQVTAWFLRGKLNDAISQFKDRLNSAFNGARDQIGHAAWAKQVVIVSSSFPMSHCHDGGIMQEPLRQAVNHTGTRNGQSFGWPNIEQLNRLAEQRARELGANFIDIATLLSYRPDSHGLADCVHWCLPGAFDIGAQLLLNALMGRLGEPIGEGPLGVTVDGS